MENVLASHARPKRGNVGYRKVYIRRKTASVRPHIWSPMLTMRLHPLLLAVQVIAAARQNAIITPTYGKTRSVGNIIIRWVQADSQQISITPLAVVRRPVCCWCLIAILSRLRLADLRFCPYLSKVQKYGISILLQTQILKPICFFSHICPRCSTPIQIRLTDNICCWETVFLYHFFHYDSRFVMAV